MTCIQYIDKRFNAKSRVRIRQAQEIISDYRAAGYTLTLRQLYYQFVARALIENSERSYKNLGKLITDARLAGLISWTAIEDRNRGTRTWLIEENEHEVLNGIEYGFAMDLWSRQDHYVEVWIEKEALSNVLEKPCRQKRVPYMACKGYLSASEAWRAGNRFRAALDRGQSPVLIHLGDHDPSGIDMTRDNDERLQLFSRSYGVDVRRIALNMDQIEQYQPPENPAKLSDSRASDYVAQHGYSSWELDALEPAVISDLVSTEIESLIDPDAWADTLQREREARKPLAALDDNWEEIKRFMEDEGMI